MPDAPIRILIVDDNAQYRQAFTRILRLEGAEVFGASDSDAALESVQSEAPDVVVTDLQMRTDREGLELIEMIKSADPLLPVIMISGVGTLEEGALATRLGATHVLQKSTIEDEMEQFLDVVRESHETCRVNRALLGQLHMARDAVDTGGAAEHRATAEAVLAHAEVDPYVRGEAYELLATLAGPTPLSEPDGSEAVVAELRRLVPAFDALDPEASRALITAEHLYQTQGADGAPDLRRPIAFSYALAVECETRARLKGRITRLASDAGNRAVLEACIDRRTRRVNVNFHRALMHAAQAHRLHFAVAAVKVLILGMLERKGKFQTAGIKDVGILLLCFARRYSFAGKAGTIQVDRPLRVPGLDCDEDVTRLAALLIELQYARNPYVHPETGKPKALAQLRELALQALKELGRIA